MHVKVVFLSVSMKASRYQSDNCSYVVTLRSMRRRASLHMMLYRLYGGFLFALRIRIWVRLKARSYI